MQDPVINALGPKIENKIRRLLSRHLIVGMACGIVVDRELAWSGGFGLADVATGRVPDRDTIFRCGSITKTFTATAIMQLRDAGKLSLNDPVVHHLPEFNAAKMNSVRVEDITIGRMLTHHSGLMREAPMDYWATLKFPTVEEIIASLPRAEVAIAPDSLFKYSNLAFYLLGEVVTRTSGVPYADYVGRNILDPLAMNMSGFELSDRMRSRMATGYEHAPYRDDPVVAAHTDIRGMSSAGQLYSSVADLSKWIAFQFRTGTDEGQGLQILRGATLAEMHRPHYLEPGWAQGYCLSWRATRRGENIFHHHGGGIHGFITFVSFNALERVGVIVLTNSTTHTAHEEIAWQIYDEILPALREAKAPPAPPVAVALPNHLKRFLGTYEAVGSPGRLDVVWREGSLAFSPPAFPTPTIVLAATDDPNVFVVKPLDVTVLTAVQQRVVGERVRFETDADGTVRNLRLSAEVFKKVLSARD